MNNGVPHRRVVIATDEPERMAEIVRLVDRKGLVPEIWSKENAADVELPIRATLLCAHDPAEWSHVLDAWAHRAFQPLSVVMLCARPGATDLEARARDAGFGRFVHYAGTGNTVLVDGASDMRGAVLEVCRSVYSLVPLIAHQCGGLTPAFSHLFAAAFDDPPVRTVSRWMACVPVGSANAIDEDLSSPGLGRNGFSAT
jgi:hypothetical protein